MTGLASNNARAAEEVARGMTRLSSGSSFAASESSRTDSADEREEGRQRR
jgi:hypothetical protein